MKTMTEPFSGKKASPKMKPCCICGKLTDGFIEQEWEEVKDDYKKENLFIQNLDAPMQDDDIIGLPICEPCYKAEFEE